MYTGILTGLDYIQEQIMLCFGIGNAGFHSGIIGNGKVCKDAFHIQTLQFAGSDDGLCSGFKQISGALEAEAGHSGIHLNMDLQFLSDFLCLFIERNRGLLIGDCLRNIIGNQFRYILCGSMSQDQDGKQDSVTAECNCLIQACYCQIIRTGFFQCMCNCIGTMSVSIGFDDSQIPAALRQTVFDSSVIMNDIIKIDLCPGSFLNITHCFFLLSCN